jgi:MFS family permease
MWGAFGPFAGMAADRFGTMRVVLVGAIAYMLGLVWMATVTIQPCSCWAPAS